MFNKLKHSAKTWASKFIKSVAITGTALLILLKPGISKGNDDVKNEIQEVLKKYPAKEISIQESKQDDSRTYHMNAPQEKMDSVTPDTTTIKNFFLNGGFLTPAEVTDFNSMRKESVKSPSRPAVQLTIFDVWETTDSDYEKAIFVTSFLDPYQKTALGKSAFKTINGDNTLKWSYSLCCKMHVQNIKTIELETKKKELEAKNKQLEANNKQLDEEIKKLDEEIKKLETAVQLLQQIEKIYDKYLNK